MPNEQHSTDNSTNHSRSNSVHEEPVQKIDIRDFELPPPPPIIETQPPEEEKRHHSKRPSVTFAEYPPVAVISTEEPSSHNHEDHNHHEEVAMKESYQETTTVAHDAHQNGDPSSQLTGFKVIGEDIPLENPAHDERRPSVLSNGQHKRRESNAEHVHFDNLEVKVGNTLDADTQPLPRIWGAVYEPSPPAAPKEIIEERVVTSPAFQASHGSSKEEFSEKVEVHHTPSIEKPVITYSEVSCALTE